MFVRAFSALALAAVLPLSAQELSGPTSGYVFDEVAKSLRVINGVPGAAYLGSALVAELDAASVSPDGKLALAQRGGRLHLLKLADGSSLDLGEFAGAARIEWSADSGSAAVAGEHNAAFRKLGSSPERGALADLEGITALAVANDGSVLAASADGLYALGSRARLLIAQDGVSGLALAADDLFVSLSARKEVLRVRGWRDSAEAALFASASAGLEDPAGVAVSADGKTVFVADRAARALFAFSSNGELASRTGLDFAPDAVERAGAYLKLNRRATAQDPLELLDAARETLFFVPAQDLTAPVED